MSATHFAGPEVLLRALVRHIEVHKSAWTRRTRPGGRRRQTVGRVPGRRNRGSGAPLDAATPPDGRRVCGPPAPKQGSAAATRGRRAGRPRGARAAGHARDVRARAAGARGRRRSPCPPAPAPGLHSYVLGPPKRSHGGTGTHRECRARAERRELMHARTREHEM